MGLNQHHGYWLDWEGLVLTGLVIQKGGRREQLEDFPQEGVGVGCILWVSVGVGWVWHF